MKLFITISLLFSVQGLADTLDVDKLLSLSLEELLEIEIDVASSRPSTIFNSVSVVSTIDRKTIERYGFKSLDDALVTVSGFDVHRSYLKQSIPTSRGVLQDHYANKVLFMIDGIPNWQAFGGDPIIGRVDINDVERIEVLKGPASVLYGTNAYSGAINVVMKKEPGKRFSASTGSDEMGGVGASVRGKFKDGRYAVSLNHRNKEEFSLLFTGQADPRGPTTANIDEYQRNTNIHVDAEYKSHLLTFNSYRGEESFYGSNISFGGGAGPNHTVNGSLLNYRYKWHSDSWGDFKFNALIDDQETEFDVAISGERLYWEGVKTTLSISNLYNFDDNWSLESGLDFEERDSKNSRFEDPVGGFIDVNGKDKTVAESSLHSQIYYASEDHNWVIGGRLVDNELFGSNFSGRVSYVYMLDKTSSLKMIVGQSFRSPALFELYGNIGCCVLGYDGLQPETANSVEISYLDAWDRWFFQGTVYLAEYKNKILRRAVSASELAASPNINPGATIYDNGEAFDAAGAELELKYSSTNWDSYINLTYVKGGDGDAFLDTFIDENGSYSQSTYNFKYVPKVILSAGLVRHWDDWSLAANGTYRGSSGSINDGVSSSFITDLTLTYNQNLSGQFLLHQFVIRNATDEYVSVPEYARRAVQSLDELPLRIEPTFGYEITWTWQ